MANPVHHQIPFLILVKTGVFQLTTGPRWQKIIISGGKKRLQQLSGYFDAFRIDHILGFFRIWQIPLEQVDGTLGFFNPAIPIKLAEFASRNIGF